MFYQVVVRENVPRGVRARLCMIADQSNGSQGRKGERSLFLAGRPSEEALNHAFVAVHSILGVFADS